MEDIEMLIEEGIAERVGEDELRINWELFRVLHPALAESMWEDHLADVDEAIDSLVQKGFLEATFRVLDDGSMNMVYSVPAHIREVMDL